MHIPQIGLGTWRSDKTKVESAVEFALTVAGYSHIDCAAVYGNEKEIGSAFDKVFKGGKLKRDDVFITSKLWNTEHEPSRVEAACKKTLSDLKLDYLDLYLVHWGIAFPSGGDIEPMNQDGTVKTIPVSTRETWEAMEKLVDRGLVKSIGVANFTTAMLIDLLTYAKIKPAVNQIEIHPYNSQEELVSFCKKAEITVTAYSPLGSRDTGGDRPVNNPVILKIAEARKKTPAQMILKWLLQRGLTTIPKSVNPERIKSNIEALDFELSPFEMKEISSLNRNHRFVDPRDWWGIPYFK